MSTIKDPRFMTYFASDYASGNTSYTSGNTSCTSGYTQRRKLTIPAIATEDENRCCCMPGYRAKIPSLGYQLTYNDYPFSRVQMDNGLWPLYARQPSK